MSGWFITAIIVIAVLSVNSLMSRCGTRPGLFTLIKVGLLLFVVRGRLLRLVGASVLIYAFYALIRYAPDIEDAHCALGVGCF